MRPAVGAGKAMDAVAETIVWWLSRRRNMPLGHTVADLADDVAQAIDELGGRVDAVVGPSYGGLIALYLAARHPDRVGRVVLLPSTAQAHPGRGPGLPR